MARIIKFHEQSAQRGGDRSDVDEPALQLRFHHIALRQSRIAIWRWSCEEKMLARWSKNDTDIDVMPPEQADHDDRLAPAGTDGSGRGSR